MTDIMLQPHEPKVPRDSDFVIFDINNPTSVINIVWDDFRELLKTFPPDYEKYFYLGERELRAQVRPETSLSLLRMRFWVEYDRAQTQHTKISFRSVIRGICDETKWKREIFPNPKKVAYLLTPPPKYLSRMEVMMNIALDEVADILSLPMRDEDGKVDKPLAALKIKILEILDTKIRGATVQKLQIDQRVLTKSADSNVDVTSLESLESGLKKIQNQIMAAQNREVLTLPERAESIVVELSEEENAPIL